MHDLFSVVDDDGMEVFRGGREWSAGMADWKGEQNRLKVLAEISYRQGLEKDDQSDQVKPIEAGTKALCESQGREPFERIFFRAGRAGGRNVLSQQSILDDD